MWQTVPAFIRWTSILVVVFATAAVGDAAQNGNDVVELPRPTGAFAVGRTTFHWSDPSRREPVTLGGGIRELMVDVWYPTNSASRGNPAPYFDASVFADVMAAGRLRGYFAGAYEVVRQGRVRIHATENAPFAESVSQAPVLIFSHGGGEARETYSTQLEDLASHGYVVAAISHSHESVATVFPGGRHVLFAPGRWPRPTVSQIEGLPPAQEENPDRLSWWAADIVFVLDELRRVNDGSGPGSVRFTGRLDLTRVGAFGHSAGGKAAAHACQVEQRLRACLNQDGLSGAAPYYLDRGGWGMNQSFMLLVRNTARPTPTEAELAAMNMTLQQAQQLRARLDARQDATLQNTGGGAYRVLLQAADTTHADFGDLPFLQATSTALADTWARFLRSILTITRAFFDETVKGLPVSIFAGRDLPEFVEAVERFPPATRPR